MLLTESLDQGGRAFARGPWILQRRATEYFSERKQEQVLGPLPEVVEQDVPSSAACYSAGLIKRNRLLLRAEHAYEGNRTGCDDLRGSLLKFDYDTGKLGGIVSYDIDACSADPI